MKVTLGRGPKAPGKQQMKSTKPEVTRRVEGGAVRFGNKATLIQYSCAKVEQREASGGTGTKLRNLSASGSRTSIRTGAHPMRISAKPRRGARRSRLVEGAAESVSGRGGNLLCDGRGVGKGAQNAPSSGSRTIEHNAPLRGTPRSGRSLKVWSQGMFGSMLCHVRAVGHGSHGRRSGRSVTQQRYCIPESGTQWLRLRLRILTVTGLRYVIR